MGDKIMEVTWQQFELYNSDVTTAFENLCRLLFNRIIFNNKAIFHSNPNNPGIEIEPVYDKSQNKYVSFQAKYFDKLNYSQIKHSFEKAVKYYKNNLDVIYLFCNKDISTKSKSYKDIVSLLNNNGIELIVISNQEILNKISDYPVLVNRYFGSIVLSKEWFEDKLADSIESLGQRHNDFNIETSTEEYFNLFIQNENAFKYINDRKYKLLDRLLKFDWVEYNNLIKRLENEIRNLPEITALNICDCLTYTDKIFDLFKTEFNEIKDLISKKENELKRDDIGKKEKNKIFDEIRKLGEILDFPLELSFSSIEKALLNKRCLIIKGDAGTGKTQLLSNSADEILNKGGYAILLLGQNFISNESIKKQMLSDLDLNIEFYDFLNYLEGLGEENNKFVYVFIDALNESSNTIIWKRNVNSLINTLDKFLHIKLVLSVRSGYETLVFDNAVNTKINNEFIPVLVHKGFFENSINAIKDFLNYYSIPFSPSYAISYEMTNPMFLKLFCDTYDGEDVEMFSLFEKIIRKTDNELNETYDLGCDNNIVINLLKQIVEYQLSMGKKISKEDLLKLPFWDTYGLNGIKLKYLSSLNKSNLLNTFARDCVEYFYFGYNLLDDFLTARHIFDRYSDKDTLINYIKDDLLEIKNAQICKFGNVGSFIVLCSLYYEKWQEELFCPIIDLIQDDYQKRSIIENYVESFQWRKSASINSRMFLKFINTYKLRRDIVFNVLFQNATKLNNPLNAEFLHQLLLNKKLSQRDYLWTTYINNYIDEENRIFQLIQLFEQGNNFVDFNKDSIILILIVFSWLLTSSNRFLRDKTSKAIIEILKNNFDLCLVILRKFEEVNDPYVIQRLYGIVFGACTKRVDLCKNDYKSLVEYVYNTIFNKDLVYPDILLRDYAKLIIERYAYEFSADKLNIDVNKIYPPYKSIEIPIVEKEAYYTEGDYSSGFNRIDMSMKPNTSSHWYGDFGRYVFQSALNEFKDVDVENAYHYAMQYIRDEMEYNDKLFSKYDCNLYNFSYRNETKKIERIGKKYQWIAMYNILARISDVHLMKNYNDDAQSYQGTWEPYVRDFDPTINLQLLKLDKLPTLKVKDFDVEALFTNSDNDDEIRKWAKTEIEFFSDHKNDLLLEDSDGNEWILLHQYQKIVNKKYEETKERSILSNGNQDIWKMSMGYLVDSSIFEKFKESLENTNFLGRWFPEIRETYQLFNREYAWSNGYNSIFQDSQLQVEVNNGEFETVKAIDFKPVFDSDKVTFESFEVSREVPIKEYIGEVTQSFLIYLWECQYDTSQDMATTIYVPCKEIIDCFNLRQKEYDGYYYDEDTLVVYDGSDSGVDSGLLIRKDYLMRFLEKNNMKLFWTCLGEKQYFRGDRNQIWSEWSGFLYLNNDGNIKGSMKFQKIK